MDSKVVNAEVYTADLIRTLTGRKFDVGAAERYEM